MLSKFNKLIETMDDHIIWTQDGNGVPNINN